MSNSIFNVFINEYEPMVHVAYQQKGSKLRGTVRTKTNVNAESVYFPKVGTAMAAEKPRHGKIQPMSIDHDKIKVDLKAYYAGDYVDLQDMAKTNINEKQVIADTAAFALGRNTDSLIINAGIQTTQEITESGSDGLTKAKVLDAMAEFGLNEAYEGDLYFVVGPKQWNELLAIEEFTNSLYVDKKQFPDKPFQTANWLGVNFIMSNLLPIAANKRTCLLYNKTAIGHAMNSNITTVGQYVAERDAYWISSKNMEGVGLIDAKGVLKVMCHEAA